MGRNRGARMVSKTALYLIYTVSVMDPGCAPGADVGQQVIDPVEPGSAESLECAPDTRLGDATES